MDPGRSRGHDRGGSIAARLSEPGSGIAITAADIGTAAAFYVVGACLGALFFGKLTDRFGRELIMRGVRRRRAGAPDRRSGDTETVAEESS